MQGSEAQPQEGALWGHRDAEAWLPPAFQRQCGVLAETALRRRVGRVRGRAAAVAPGFGPQAAHDGWEAAAGPGDFARPVYGHRAAGDFDGVGSMVHSHNCRHAALTAQAAGVSAWPRGRHRVVGAPSSRGLWHDGETRRGSGQAEHIYLREVAAAVAGAAPVLVDAAAGAQSAARRMVQRQPPPRLHRLHARLQVHVSPVVDRHVICSCFSRLGRMPCVPRSTTDSLPVSSNAGAFPSQGIPSRRT